MRFHVVGLPHTRTSKEFCGCAYTQNVLNFCKMMHALGHVVIHYGAEGSDVVADELVTVITSAEQEAWFGPVDFNKLFPVEWDPSKEYWRTMNYRVASEVTKRYQERDFLCVIGGDCQQQIGNEISGGLKMAIVEYGVGYYGTFSKFRVFPSYTHQTLVYARQSRDPDVSLYDAVIPHYFDPADFPVVFEKQDYLLFIGRMIRRKGIQIAVEAAQRAGMKLKIGGQGLLGETPTHYLIDGGMLLPKDTVEYLGYASVQQRAALMGHARALLAPTTYVEPFGMVAVEAQLCGTPAITTDFGGFTETVRHGYSGYRCHTLGQFTQAILRLSELRWSPDEIAMHAVDTYSLDRIQHMYQEYFEMVSELWQDGWYSQGARDQLSWLTQP